MLLINKNKGTASNMKPSRVDNIAWGAISGENPSNSNIPSPRLPNEKATGKLASSSANMTPSIRRSFIHDLP